MVKKKEFIVPYPENCRKRYSHTRIKNRIVDFKVQLEVFLKNRWYPIVRYDTAHGFAHRDIIHFDGRIEKIPLFLNNYNETLNFADTDIKMNWQLYLKRFLEEVKNHD
ncbi:MAG: hypothetical protein AUJ85_09155 [Elusimicrobia bacterium CG1_02_37_114]|nr:MAG: hypothetical protein AUJ85_09155 [Elusimicrobia bacterium CG1_02_37_114]PIV53462.1 MAG: hypothetical protein COS17_03775 [Elusimicrobia bacterium CG02_land_8_20_14_3_00_37_13]PIZ12747.1 MAG: hypothetical protein COY53_08420 [Elusimicrobia bacterium CG_4_10_14_0_8_um_filter_37_32]